MRFISYAGTVDTDTTTTQGLFKVLELLPVKQWGMDQRGAALSECARLYEC